MKKLILVICLVCTAGIADAKSKRNEYHSKHNGQVVQTVVYSNFGALRISPKNDLVKIIIINKPYAKTHYVKSHIAKHKIIHHRNIHHRNHTSYSNKKSHMHKKHRH